MRWTFLFTGLLALVTGVLLVPSPTAAEDPPQFVTKFLVNQRVPVLPEGPVCWNIVRQTLAPGARVPAQGYRAYPHTVAAVLDGQVQIEYSGGPSHTARAGEGLFIGQDNWFALTNTGTTPATAVMYTMTCDRMPAGIPGFTQLANSGPLDGVRHGVSYDIVFVDVSGVPGSMIAPHTHPSTESAYLLDGALALSTPAGVKEYRAGEMIIVPFGTAHMGTMVGTTNGRLVSAYLVPTGQDIRDYVTTRLPAPALPTALPRTGDAAAPLAGVALTLLGTLLLAAGLRLRRPA